MLAAAVSGAASVGVLLPDSFEFFHGLLHGYETWIVALSAVLVAGGAWLEAAARREGRVRDFPWLFAFSCACFLFNLAVVLMHRA